MEPHESEPDVPPKTLESKPKTSAEQLESELDTHKEDLKSEPETATKLKESEQETPTEVSESEPETTPEHFEPEPETPTELKESEPETLKKLTESEPETTPEHLESEPETPLKPPESEPETTTEPLESKPETLTVADNTNVRKISDLPEELLLRVFQNLNLVDRKQSRLVCKSWMRLLYDSTIMNKEVITVNYAKIDDYVSPNIPTIVNLRLNITSCTVSPAASKKFFKKYGPKILTCQLVSSFYYQMPIQEVVDYCPVLKTMTIGGSSVYNCKGMNFEIFQDRMRKPACEPECLNLPSPIAPFSCVVFTLFIR